LDEARASAQKAIDLLSATARWCKAIAILFAVGADRGGLGEMSEIRRRFQGVEPNEETLAEYTHAAAILIHGLSVAGRRTEAASMLERIERTSSASEDPTTRGWYLYGRSAYDHLLEPKPALALSSLEEAGLGFSQAWDYRHFGLSQVLLGAAQLRLGLLEEAEATFRGVSQLADHLSEPQLGIYAKAHLTESLAENGDPADDEECHDIGVGLTKQVDARSYCAGLAHIGIAYYCATTNRWAEVETEARQALTSLRSVPTYAGRALILLMRSLRAQWRAPQALETAREAESMLAAAGGIGHGEIRVRLAIAETFRAASDAAACRRELATALAQLERCAREIGDPAMRESFLARVPENVALRVLADQVGM
jgi:tetratricopeptide (TPR) repeat protein